MGEVEASLLELDRGTSKFDVEVSMLDGGQEMIGSFEYRTALFDEATISRMAGHYLRVLETVAARPEVRIEAIPLLSGPERQQLLYGWNDTATDYRLDTCVPALFEVQAGRSSSDAATAVARMTARTRRA